LFKKTTVIIGIIVIAAIAIGVAAYYAISASFQSQSTQTAADPLPVVLVHGLGEDAFIWQTWESLLEEDRIPFYTITFQKSDDRCGSAIAHATELAERIQEIKRETGSERVNIVGHSKGGVDARVYLANGTAEVENLIMIGTPNDGTPLAEMTSACAPAIWDILPESNATMAEMNPNTQYWTIAGDWQPNVGGNPVIPGADDGQVPVASVESEGYFQSLGRTENQHLELLGEQEYDMARNVLAGPN
jgi:pimeloyl-ACP methyl ester carboxylesterase